MQNGCQVSDPAGVIRYSPEVFLLLQFSSLAFVAFLSVMLRYVPAASHCPLTFLSPSQHQHRQQQQQQQLVPDPSPDAASSPFPPTGFLVLDWGSVVVLNPPSCSQGSATGRQTQAAAPDYTAPGSYPSPTVLSPSDILPAMSLAMAHIRALLSLPPLPPAYCLSPLSHPPSVSPSPAPAPHICVRRVGRREVAAWEADVLLRARVAADLATAVTSLKSTAALVSSLSSMVVPMDIQAHVNAAMSALSAVSALAGRNVSLTITESADSAQNKSPLELMTEGASTTYMAVQAAASSARRNAEAALFHPAMEAGIFYPLEHHVAVYAVSGECMDSIHDESCLE